MSTASSIPRAFRSIPSTWCRASPMASFFSRDRNVCAYCGNGRIEEDLTRVHIIPLAQRGVDSWINVVTACRGCNHRKSNRTPEQAHMPLLYTPYVPRPVGRFHLAQPPHTGGSDGFFDGAHSQNLAPARLALGGVRVAFRKARRSVRIPPP